MPEKKYSLCEEVINEVWGDIPLNCHCDQCDRDLTPETLMLDIEQNSKDWEYMARKIIKIVSKRLCAEISSEFADMDDVKINKL